MKKLKLKLSRAIETYKTSNESNKQFLINLYGEEHFITDVKDRLKGYSSACVILNRKELAIDHFAFLGSSQAKKQFARHKIQTCIEAINEGWIPNYDNTNEAKYEIWMYGKNTGFSSWVGYDSGASVGSDLVLQTREKGEIIEKICRQDYIDYLF